VDSRNENARQVDEDVPPSPREDVSELVAERRDRVHIELSPDGEDEAVGPEPRDAHANVEQ
jgi:hypothetical protein